MTGSARTLTAGIVVACLASQALAGEKRAQPDVQAIREATSHSPDPEDRWISSRSLSHFLLAMLAKERGDLDTVIDELRLASLYETQSPFPRYLLASELARRGDVEAAEHEAREALTIDKAHGPSLMLLGRLESARGRPAQAIDTLRRAAKANPDDPEPLALLVQAHLAKRESDQALAVAEKLDAMAEGAKDPAGKATRASAQALSEVADALAASGEDERAEALYRRSAARDPSNSQRTVVLGAFLEARGRTREAAEAYAAAFAPAGGDVQLAAAAGRLFLAAGERAKALSFVDTLRSLSDALARHADDALLSLGQAFFEAGAAEEARKAFEAAREVAPDRAEAYHALGTALEALGRFEKAEAAYAKVPSRDELGLSARVRGAWCEHRRGASASAETSLKELRLEHPESPEVALALAAVLSETRRPKEAAEVLSRAMREAASPAVAAAQARMLRKLGKAEEALSELGAARGRWPEDEALALAEVEALSAAGRHADAAERGAAVVARSPRSAAALEATAAELSYEAASLEEAEGLARRALAEKPEKPGFQATLGLVLVRRGQVEAGLELLERASRADGSDPRLAARLAEARAEAGRTGEAKKAFERALSLAKAHGDLEAQAEAARGLERLARKDPAPP